METQVLRKRKTAITAASIERTQARVENAIATAFEPEEVLQAYEMAAACKLLAKQVDASRSIQNRCAASHTKAVRKVGEVTQRLREEGRLAKGRPKKSVASGDTLEKVSCQQTLSDLGLSRDIAAAGVKLLSLTPEQIDAKAADSASAAPGSRSLFPGRRQPLGSRRPFCLL